MSSSQLISADNEVFRTYAFWAAVLVIKMLATALLTTVARFRTNTFANPEDLPSKKIQIKFGVEAVERVRRAHRNDLENVLPLIAVGFLYTLTNPAAFLAINLFRAAGIARLVHTFVYAVYVLPQPARALSFLVPLLATLYMAIATILHFL